VGGGAQFWNGWIDEVRISKGIARWTNSSPAGTKAFTPPTRAYSTLDGKLFAELDDIAATGIGKSGTTHLRSPLETATLRLTNDWAWFNGDSTSADDINIIEFYGQDINTTNAQAAKLGSIRTKIPAGSSSPGLGNMVLATGVNGIQDALSLLTAGDAKVHGKLGVGGLPGTQQLKVVGGIELSGQLKMGGGSVSRCYFNDQIWAEGATNGSRLDFGEGFTDIKFRQTGNVGIGVDPTVKLDIKHDAASNAIANTAFNIYTRRGSSTPVGFGGKINLQLRNNANDAAVDAAYLSWAVTKAADGDLQPKLVLGTGNAGSPADRLSILYDGTQDHHANRIVNSQTVSDLHRTAEPSLRFDGSNNVTVPNNAALNFGEGNFTLSAWIKLKDYTANTVQAIIYRQSGSVRYYLSFRGDSNDKIQAAIDGDAGSNYDINSAENAISDNNWHHVVATIDRGVNNHKIYIDGVQSGSTSTGGTSGSINPNIDLMIGSNNASASYFDGEIKDVRIHNRVLEDTEVAAAYNGESTPWIYADAGGTELISNANDRTFGGAVVDWVAQSGVTITVVSGELKIDFGTGSSNFANLDNTGMELGKKYRVTLDIRSKAGDGDIPNVEIGSLPTHVRSGTNYFTVTATEAGATVTGEVVVLTTPYATRDFMVMMYAENNKTVYIDNVSIVQVGEVAAYTPQSITELREITYGGTLAEFDTWCDTTSNGNHGKITGATIVGNNHVYAPLTVKGRSEVGDKNLSSCGSIWLGDHATNRGLIDYDEGTGQGLLRISSYRDADSAKLELATYRTPRLDIDGLGTVRATNSGGALQQVARVWKQDFTLATTETYEVITHNLNTANIVVSVRTNPSANDTGEMVEVAIKTGDNSNNTPLTKCTLTFASAPAANTNYTATIIG